MNVFRQAYALDLRSLAMFRIALGLIIFGDLLARWQADGLVAFYTDAGVLPRKLLTQRFAWPEIWSLHLGNGSTYFQVFLFLVAALFALLLIVGYRTRVVTAVSWLLLVSLHSRDPFILHGGDALLRLLLFWSIFLPLGKHFSADSMSDFSDTGNTSAPVAPSLAFAVQIAAVYFFAYLLKTGPEWKDGTAVAYALNIEQMATPFGQFLLDRASGSLAVLTSVARYAELVIAVLVLFPWQATRTLVVFLILFLQLGFALSLRVGHFPFVAAAAALALLPASFWDRRRPAVTKQPSASGYHPMEIDPTVRFLVLAVMVTVLLVNFATVGWLALPRPLTHLVNFVRLDQEWNMFAPSPREPDGWYVILGKRQDGSIVDAWRMRPPAINIWQKPPAREMNAQYPSERWAVYMMDLHKPEMREHLPLFASYLCRRVNSALPADAPTRLRDFDIFFVERLNQLDRSPSQPLQRKLLWTQRCPPR